MEDSSNWSCLELDYRMIHRWSQENYFKYDSDHRGIDALVTHQMDPAADGKRRVRNPDRKALNAAINTVERKLSRALLDYGRHQLDADDQSRESQRANIDALSIELAGLQVRRDEIPATVAFDDTKAGHDAVQPQIESRRLMHCFRIASHRAELGLLELIRPHFKEWRHEGRSLIRTILHSPGSIRVQHQRLHIEIAPRASPYKTRALQALCQQLTAIAVPRPGTDLVMSFAVQPPRSPS